MDGIINPMPKSYQFAAFFLVLFGLGLVATLWILTALKNHLLLKEFKIKMPQQALAVFPEVFSAGRTPKKFWFFFSVSAQELLSADPRLNKMRSQFVRMAVASLVAPFLFFLIAAVLTLVIRH
jgi:hypothetical protein